MTNKNIVIVSMAMCFVAIAFIVFEYVALNNHNEIKEQAIMMNAKPTLKGVISSSIITGVVVYKRCDSNGFCFESTHKEDL